MRILIADDDESIRKVMGRMLAAGGYEVESVAEGAAALERALQSPPDLIISDVLMAGMNGYELCRRVKGDARLRRIPFVFCTAVFADNENRELALKLGASGFISKPVEYDVLLKEIADILKELKPPAPAEGTAEDVRKWERGCLQAISAKIEEKARELKRSERRYRSLVESLRGDIFFYVRDMEGRFTYISPSVADVLGYSPQELAGECSDYLKNSPLNSDISRWPLPSARREQASFEALVTHRDGGVRILDILEIPLSDENGAMAELEGVVTDITRHRRQEEALRESEQRFQLSFETGVSKCITGPDGRFVAVSKALCGMLGYNASELLRHGFAVFMHPEDVRASQEMVRRALSGEMQKYSIQKRYVRKDGGVIWADVSTSLVRDPGGKPRYFITEIQNITGQKLAEEEKAKLEAKFRQAQKMEAVGRLAGGVAHDFNNILTTITGCSDMLLKSLPPGDPKTDDIREISKAAGRAAALTRQLLAFSRKQVLQPKVIDLNAAVSDMGTLIRRVIGEDVELSIKEAPGTGKIMADPSQLEQIIMNLAVNAKDAMPDGGTLALETANVELGEDYAKTHPEVAPGWYVMLAVSDTGIGMDPATLACIFEPFFTTKEQGKGTGLGLATVYGIVKQSGGSVSVYSEPGRGTTFKIYFRRADVPAAEETLVETRALPADLRGTETVLLVEDDEALRRLACRTLAGSGYMVLAAATPAEALAISKEHEDGLSLLITDVVMPGMNGRELSEKVLALAPGIKVLFMSGYTTNIIAHHGVLDSGIAFLEKPFTPDALLSKVREILGVPVAMRT